MPCTIVLRAILRLDCTAQSLPPRLRPRRSGCIRVTLVFAHAFILVLGRQEFHHASTETHIYLAKPVSL
jgi:hypothetical protein